MAMTIGTLAEAAGVNVPTVRYYERRGIIAEPPRTASGYRELERLRTILRELVRSCEDRERTGPCPVLAMLEEGEEP